MATMQIVPACKNVEAQYVEMKVPLYSYGCEKKVKKALSNLKGIYSVNVDFEQQKVTVWGICNKYDVLATMKTKRKGAHFWDSIEELQPPSPSPSPSPPRPSYHRRSLSLIKGRSSNWRSWKKVFVRSYSF